MAEALMRVHVTSPLCVDRKIVYHGIYNGGLCCKGRVYSATGIERDRCVAAIQNIPAVCQL